MCDKPSMNVNGEWASTFTFRHHHLSFLDHCLIAHTKQGKVYMTHAGKNLTSDSDEICFHSANMPLP